MGLAPVSISEVSTRGLQTRDQDPGLRRDKVKLKDLAIMSRQMATMISAGLSLLRALTILAEQTESKPLAKVARPGAQRRRDGRRAVRRARQAHRDLPAADDQHDPGRRGRRLPRRRCSLRSRTNYEAEVKLRGKIKSAMTYPVVVFVIAILAVVGMLLFIVPVFAKMFADLGGDAAAADADPRVAVASVMKMRRPSS